MRDARQEARGAWDNIDKPPTGASISGTLPLFGDNRYRRGSRGTPTWLAIAGYMAAVAVVVAVIFGVLAAIPFQEKTVTTTGPDGTKTTETTRDKPGTVEALVAGLGIFGGVLVIPVKFAWDELSNRSNATRQTEADVRGKLHTYMEKYYKPFEHALSGIKFESKNWLEELKKEAERKEIVIDRWLYSVALFLRTRRKMRDEGGNIFLHNLKDEETLVDALRHVVRLFSKLIEVKGLERSLLASSLSDLEHPDFLTFRDRCRPLEEEPSIWMPSDRYAALREFRKNVLAEFSKESCKKNLDDLGTVAGHAEQLFLYFETDIYSGWYRDRDTERLRKARDEAEDWLTKHEKELTGAVQQFTVSATPGEWVQVIAVITFLASTELVALGAAWLN
jgi:hypothetical protein